jgi:hypothetical protein
LIIYKRTPIIEFVETTATEQPPSLQIRVDANNDIPLSPIIPRIPPYSTQTPTQSQSQSQKGTLKMVELEEDHDFN